MPKTICDKHGCERVFVGKRRKCLTCDREYQRANYAARIDVLRPRKAAWMAAARKDPNKREALLASQRKAWANGGAERDKKAKAAFRKEKPFVWRCWAARRNGIKATPEQLEALWNKQGGRCALTGRQIAIEEADLDHIIPTSRGGANELSNVRWTWNRANEAKGNMLDGEFVAMCSQVAEWIGRQILAHAEGA